MHFLESKAAYRDGRALVFHNIDYLMITVRLLMKDYAHLARCLVPIGAQIDLTLDERADMLRRHTRRFAEDEIRLKFAASASVSVSAAADAAAVKEGVKRE